MDTFTGDSEIELKYGLNAPEDGQRIIESDYLVEMTVPDSIKTVKMEATYYDDDGILAKNKVGYRIRKENDKYIATLKYSLKSINSTNKPTSLPSKIPGLSRRFEHNIEVDDIKPNPIIFCESVHAPDVEALLRSVKPVAVFRTEITRILLLLKHRSSLIEVAFDSGRIIACPTQLTSPEHENASCSSKELPVCEIECELKSGSAEDLLEFGRELASEFNLLPLNKSKLQRGLSLI